MTVLERMKKDKRVQSVSDERSGGDGVWVYLKPGFKYFDVHQIHEDTPSGCLRVLPFIDRCDCVECKGILK
jgi:hypothetical protein